jgi:hypothetical protein
MLLVLATCLGNAIGDLGKKQPFGGLKHYGSEGRTGSVLDTLFLQLAFCSSCHLFSDALPLLSAAFGGYSKDSSGCQTSLHLHPMIMTDQEIFEA